MTHAICVLCGAMKFGCLLPCRNCGLRPATRRQFAYSYLFSDHYQTVDDLRQMSREIIETGEWPTVTPEIEAKLIEAFAPRSLPD